MSIIIMDNDLRELYARAFENLLERIGTTRIAFNEDKVTNQFVKGNIERYETKVSNIIYTFRKEDGAANISNEEVKEALQLYRMDLIKTRNSVVESLGTQWGSSFIENETELVEQTIKDITALINNSG